MNVLCWSDWNNWRHPLTRLAWVLLVLLSSLAMADVMVNFCCLLPHLFRVSARSVDWLRLWFNMPASPSHFLQQISLKTQGAYLF